MTIFVFGNPDLPMDAMPIVLIPELAKKFPGHAFVRRDPLDEFDEVPNPLVILDTVVGIEKVKELTSLDSFEASPRVTMHDLDLWSHLQLLRKVGKLKKVRIIGIPPGMNKDEALQQLTPFLSS